MRAAHDRFVRSLQEPLRRFSEDRKALERLNRRAQNPPAGSDPELEEAIRRELEAKFNELFGPIDDS